MPKICVSLPATSLEELELLIKNSLQLDHGDYLVFLTDGVVEARNKEKAEMSFEGFMTFLSKAWKNPQQIVQEVEKEIELFTESANQHDDITLVVLKWC